MPGKLPPDDLLSHVFGRTGAPDESVLQGPAVGEDAAAIDVPDDTLVVSTDPISLAASQAGTLGVHVACNDVAASGGDPRWLTVVCMLPTDDGEALETVARDLDTAATEIGVSIVGGHTEYVDALERPLLSLTAIGTADEFVPTGGAEPGDRVVLTAGAGIEGTAILAADFGDDLAVSAETVERATAFFDDISVVPDGHVLREFATAMHDPTEGGVAAGLLELACASDVRLDVDRGAIPIRPETEVLCEAADVDPLRIFGSGGLLGTVPEEAIEDCLDALARAGIEAAEIGVVRARDVAAGAEPGLVLDGEPITEPIEDDLYPLWADADG